MATNETPFLRLALLECARRSWEVLDPTFYGYRSKRERFPRRYDLGGVIDLLAARNDLTHAIQFTSASNHAARRRKILSSPNLPFLRASGWILTLWSWREKGSEMILREEIL